MKTGLLAATAAVPRSAEAPQRFLESASSTLRVDDKRYFEVHAVPVMDDEGEAVLPTYLLVTARDVSSNMIQRQKLSAIYQAGLELGDLQPQELLEMSVEERIER